MSTPVKKNYSESRWSAEVLRTVFSDPQLFAARQLLGRGDAEVSAQPNAGRLHVATRIDGRPVFATVALAKMNARGRGFESSCTCGEDQPCVHVVAGYLLAAAHERALSADDVLLELIGENTVSEPPRSEADEGSLTSDLRNWLSRFPAAPAAIVGGEAHSTLAFVLEPTQFNAPVLDRIGAFMAGGGMRRRVPLAELATSAMLDRRLQRACSLLLAAGAAFEGTPWGPEAAGALLELAEAGRLRVAGDDNDLQPGPPEQAALEWERGGETYRLRVRTKRELRHVIDAEPPLYIDIDHRVGVLQGLSARAWGWSRNAPVIPIAGAAAFDCLVEARPELAGVLPPLPEVEVEAVSAEALRPLLRLTGQGSKARAKLSFDYGGVVVEEPGLPTDYRRLVAGRWRVAHRDRTREAGCVEQLLASGLRQQDGVTWSFFLQAHFADTTRAQWLRLQNSLLRDLEFDQDWEITIDADFGYRREVLAEKETADASRRFNRRHSGRAASR